jgi:hypothetical protein
MIIEAIITALLFIPNILIGLLPTITTEFPDGITEVVRGTFGVVSYFIPVAALVPIIVLYFSMDLFKVFMALVVRIKSFIPSMGA